MHGTQAARARYCFAVDGLVAEVPAVRMREFCVNERVAQLFERMPDVLAPLEEELVRHCLRELAAVGASAGARREGMGVKEEQGPIF